MKYLTQVLAVREIMVFELETDLPVVVDSANGLPGEFDIDIGGQIVSIRLGKDMVTTQLGESWGIKIEQTKLSQRGQTPQGA